MNLALFDFDGTITFGDTYTPFLYFAIDPKRIFLGRFVLAPVVAGYRLGVVSESRARVHVSAFGFRGTPESDVREAGALYARNVLPKTIRTRALKRIKWHKAQGDTVVVVSASLDVYLRAWCREHDLDLICTELEVEDGIMTGRYREGDCVGKEKARRILKRYRPDDYQEIYAYGDTPDDDEMLRLASRRYFRWREVDAAG